VVVARIRAGNGVARDGHRLTRTHILVGEGTHPHAREGEVVCTDPACQGGASRVQRGADGTIVNLIDSGNAAQGNGFCGNRVDAAGGAQDIVIAGQSAITAGV